MKPRTPRSAYEDGLSAESKALAWLTAKGYRTLAERYVAKGGEVDLIVQLGTTIAFVEVKARARIEDAEIAIGEPKIARISCAARQWVAQNPTALNYDLRGDAVFIAPGRQPRHVEAAFVVAVDVYDNE